MYQNNSNNNSNGVGGISYGYYYEKQPSTIAGMNGDRSLQRIIQQPLPQETLRYDEQKQKQFSVPQQNEHLHQNMMLFDESGRSVLNGNGNSNSSQLHSMNHPTNGYYYDYSSTAAMEPRFYQNPPQHQILHVPQNIHAVLPHPFSYYDRSNGGNESPAQSLNVSQAIPSSAVMQAQQYQSDPRCVSKVTETKYVVTRNGPLGSKGQENAAASFFAKANRDQVKLQNHKNSSKNENENCSNVFLKSNSLEQQANTHLRTKNKHNLDSKYNINKSDDESSPFSTNFCKMLKTFPPSIPNVLLKKLDSDGQGKSGGLGSTTSSSNYGKIRVLLKVANSQFDSGFEDINENSSPNSSFQIDKKRRQITLYDPSFLNQNSVSKRIDDIEETSNVPSEATSTSELHKKVTGAPKMFAFDGVFNTDDSQEEIATCALTDIVAAVLNGNDGCLFCYGHANLGKSRSMLGSDEYATDMGLVPIAISWLYRAIKERKVKSGARFSVRVSALEISSQRENLRDLLATYATENDQPPGAYLRQNAAAAIATAAGGGYLSNSSGSSISSYLQNQSEIRAPSVEKAAYYLDAALSGRSADVRGRESHLIYTIHVYQYSVDPSSRGGVSGGRSRMHLIDFGGCERTKHPGGGGGITLSGLGNVILGIFNGQKALPHRESKVTQILRECLGSIACNATMVAHVSPDPCHYSETLHTVQLASRLHRMRRKRMKGTSSGSRRRLRSASKGNGSSSSGHRSTSGSDITTGSGTSTNASSSEFSCDTVVYRGASGSGYSDGSCTDGEHPPMFYMRSAASSREGSIRGSLDEIPRPASAGSRRRKILTNGAISPRQCLSPSPRSPAGRAMSDCGGTKRNMLPAIPEVVAGDKMPLSGLVPIQSNHRYRQLCHINNLRQQQRSQKNDLINIRRHREGSTGSRRSEEIWIDCDPTKKEHSSKSETTSIQQSPDAKSQNLSSKKRSSYGYMDSQKAQMINSWVENQSNPDDINQNQQGGRVGSKESLEYAHDVSRVQNATNTVIHPNNQPSLPEFKVLTQFKTIDTSDDGGVSSIISCDNQDEVKVQIHQAQEPITTGGESPACMSYLESDLGNMKNKTSNKPTPPPPPPRKTSPRTFIQDKRVSDSPPNDCEELKISREERKINIGTDDDEFKLKEEKDLTCTDETAKNNKDSISNEEMQRKTRARKPSAQNMLFSVQRQSYHEDELLDNHPLRVLSESNLTVVSSFGGSLNNVNVEDEADNGEQIDANLSFFKLPELPQGNLNKNCVFNDNIIDQRFKEFEILHNQGNNLNIGDEHLSSHDPKTSSKPMLPTFVASALIANNQEVVELSEYTSLNETRESNISNLYCEPFNSNFAYMDTKSHELSSAKKGVNFHEHSLNNLSNMPSPNLRYNLPARALQPDPDGSSNPEINLVGTDRRQLNQLRPVDSSIDNYDNLLLNSNVCYDNCKISKSSSGNNNSSIIIDNVRKSPNNNTSIGTEGNSTFQNNSIEEEKDFEAKESFGSRFLRLFGSKRKKNGKKRSKSCETNTESSNKYKSISGSSVVPIATNPKVKFLVDSERHSRRSASASPDMLITAGRKLTNKTTNFPDSLDSKLTNDSGFYNFESKIDLDVSGGNNSQNTTGSSNTKNENHSSMYDKAGHREWENDVDFHQDQIVTNFNHIMIQKHPHSIFYGGDYNEKRPKGKHRKSSGYDSLDGDEESSSMDSAGSHHNKAENIHDMDWNKITDNEKNKIKNGQTKSSSGGLFKRLLSKNPSRSNSTNFTKECIVEEEINSHEGTLIYQDSNEVMRKLSFEDKFALTSETSKAHVAKPLNMEILQYDEMDIIRMDFRSKQVSSSLASTANNSHSSTYSSTHS